MKRKAWVAYLAAGGGFTLAYLFGPQVLRVGPVFNVIGASAALAIVVATWLHRPERRLAWYLIAVSQLLFVSGDVIAYNYERFFGSPLPFPSIADALYLSVYPCLIGGILLLIRRRTPGRDRASLIDSLVVTVGIGFISWVYLMAPYAHDSSLSLPLKLISIAYPLADVLVLAFVARLAVGAGKREAAFYLLAGSAVALIVTDSIYGWILLNVPQGYATGGLLDGGWALFYLLLGAAALHPSMRTLSEPAAEVDPRLTKGRLTLLTLTTLIAPAVMTLEASRHRPVDVPVVASAAAALFLLVVARMSGLVRRQEQSAARERALREAGVAFVTATNRAGIYEATLRAAQSLASDASSVRMLVSLEGAETFSVVASLLEGTVTAEDASVPLTAFAEARGDRLLAHRPFQASIEESGLAEHLAFPPGASSAFVAPLFMMDELRGLLIVTGAAGVLTRSVCDGLQALASQVALALESAVLTEDLLRKQSEARFASLVQNSSDLVTVLDLDTTIGYVSPSIERVLGYGPQEILGTRFADLIDPNEAPGVVTFLSGHGDGTPGLIEFRVRHRDGTWVHVETLRTNLLDDPNVRGIVLNTRDVTERKVFEEQLAHQAFHDSVTGLANRALFKDRVEHALERLQRDQRPLAVLFIDLDDFKTINDSLGHAAGDQLLREVGERLRETLRAADTAARLGGDEFAVLVEETDGHVEPADVATRILDALKTPFRLEGTEVFVRASIGIATGEKSRVGADSADQILRNADVAMYMAKDNGKGRYQVFEPAMHHSALRRLELKADLQRAVEKREFILQYQPIIALETSRISGVEALIRWQHPVRGLVPPLEFIPLAEETGLIVPIGAWVLEEACTRARELHERFPSPEPPYMAVNLSARQLQREEIVDEVRDVLVRTGLDPSSLVLEITESVMMADMDLSIDRLRQLKQLGVRLAVDDFGTGYSSLNYIRQFPVDILKVDKSFVDGVNEGGEASALTAAVIELAGILKLKPVAEGIERANQLERLVQLHCEFGQGFLFAKPLDLEDLNRLVEEHRSGEAAA